MTALVTGVAGFIGSSLSDRLIADGEEVIGVDCFIDYYPRSYKERNLSGLEQQDGFRLIEKPLQDLNLDELLAKCDRVFHLAAQAGVRASWGTEFSIYTDNNILATQRLLESAAVTGIESFVFASSSSVYGNASTLPMVEEQPLHPVSPYGVSKLAAEQLCRLYTLNHGVPTASLRYFTVYGPRQRPDMAFHRLLRSAKTGESFPLYGDGKQTRDFTFVADAVAATIAASRTGKPGAVYNIGGGSRVSMLEVIETIEKITGETLTIDAHPVQKGDMRDTYADTTAARRDLDYQPATSLAEGLASEWEWMQQLQEP